VRNAEKAPRNSELDTLRSKWLPNVGKTSKGKKTTREEVVKPIQTSNESEEQRHPGRRTLKRSERLREDGKGKATSSSHSAEPKPQKPGNSPRLERERRTE
jgi:hypothetical protein